MVNIRGYVREVTVLCFFFSLGLVVAAKYESSRTYTVTQYSDTGQILNTYKAHSLLHYESKIHFKDESGNIIELTGTVKVFETNSSESEKPNH